MRVIIVSTAWEELWWEIVFPRKPRAPLTLHQVNWNAPMRGQLLPNDLKWQNPADPKRRVRPHGISREGEQGELVGPALHEGRCSPLPQPLEEAAWRSSMVPQACQSQDKSLSSYSQSGANWCSPARDQDSPPLHHVVPLCSWWRVRSQEPCDALGASTSHTSQHSSPQAAGIWLPSLDGVSVRVGEAKTLAQGLTAATHVKRPEGKASLFGSQGQDQTIPF